MLNQHFEDWFKNLKDIWENRTPEKIVDICAENFFWYETQFDEPLRTKEQLLDEWRGILEQEDVHVSYEVLATNDLLGIAHWHATFVNSLGEDVELDGIFQITLDEKGKCTEFHQWRDKK